MGLDMYLARSINIANYSFDAEGQQLGKAVLDALKIEDQAMYADGSIDVRLPAAYWRKANAIHGWFVSNCQDDNDDCREAYVSREQLEALRDLCKAILAGEKPKEDLPPTAGFFFGDTESDEYYLTDLRDTVQKLDAVLAAPSIGRYGDSFYYHSSW